MPKQKFYTVIWECGIFADSPEAAAREALAMQRDPNSTATVFKVCNDDDEQEIDLSGLDEERANILRGTI